MTRCDGCQRPTAASDLEIVDVLLCSQTHSSPAEWDTKLLCSLCRSQEEPDEDYERANIRYGLAGKGGL